jgi:hypothetical protein
MVSGRAQKLGFPKIHNVWNGVIANIITSYYLKSLDHPLKNNEKKKHESECSSKYVFSNKLFKN